MNYSLIDTEIPDIFIPIESDKYRINSICTGDEIIKVARFVLGQRVLAAKKIMLSSKLAKDFFVTQLASLTYEVFCIAFLNNQNQLLAVEQMFRGSLSEAHVYPREVVKRALELNSASIIVAHNHPSGSLQPSQSDIDITNRLMKALQLL